MDASQNGPNVTRSLSWTNAIKVSVVITEKIPVTIEAIVTVDCLTVWSCASPACLSLEQ